MRSACTGPQPAEVPKDLARLVETARREWLAALNTFDFVTDPDLVDYAIYNLQAAERRYMHLLKMAARWGAPKPLATGEDAPAPPTASSA